MDLDRLRDLAREPERTAMSRSQQFPSMTSQVLLQKQEIDALRRGILEAIVEIERLQEDARFTELMHKEEIGHWQEQE
jgi:chaperonin cofactor prefoldin